MGRTQKRKEKKRKEKKILRPIAWLRASMGIGLAQACAQVRNPEKSGRPVASGRPPC